MLTGLPLAGANSKPHPCKQNVQEMKRLPKTTFTEKPFDDLRQNTTLSLDQITPWITWPLKATIEDGPHNQEEINRRKIEKSFHFKTVGIWQD